MCATVEQFSNRATACMQLANVAYLFHICKFVIHNYKNTRNKNCKSVISRKLFVWPHCTVVVLCSKAKTVEAFTFLHCYLLSNSIVFKSKVVNHTPHFVKRTKKP